MTQPRLAPILLAGLLVAAPMSAGVARADDKGTVQGAVVVNPLKLSLTLPDRRIMQGTRFEATGTVENLGSAALQQVAVALRADPDSLQFNDGPTRSLVTLAGGASADLSWSLCGKASGLFIIVLSATAMSAEGEVFSLESPAQVLEIVQPPGRPAGSGCPLPRR